MRIWAFPSFYPYDYPGHRWRGTFAHRQYKGLIENGVDLKVIIPVLWNPPYPFSELYPNWKEMHKMGYPKERVHEGVPIYHPRVANMRPGRFFKKPYPERFVDAVVSFFKDNNIQLDPKNDMIYSQWLPECYLAQLVAQKLGLKSAILGIGDDVIIWPRNSEINLKSFDKLLTEADLRLYNADYLGREANSILGREVPYDVTYFGVDYDLFKPVTAEESIAIRKQYNIPLDKVVILIIGSALIRKGWLDLFDAIKEIKKTNSDFVLVGGHAGTKDIDIAEEVAARGLTENFVDLGEVKPELLNVIYNAADIFCLPSHWEGLATVIMESMSSGLAVMTTNVCGQPEIVTHNVTGILIPPKEPGILKDELLSLINDKEKRERLGKTGRDFIVNTWGNFTENAVKLKRLMEEVLAGKKQ